MVFRNLYSKYYNLLYKDKDYQTEGCYILNLIKKFANKRERLLDIGCGTGKHASIIAQYGYNVTGIDLSSSMIDVAQKSGYPNCEFFVADARDFNLYREFDVIISLFHVISYQNNNDQLEAVFSNISKHLTSQGIFIFDFWYAPAVLIQQPSIRIKRVEDRDIKITRISEPNLYVNDNLVDINFELIIEEKFPHQIIIEKELHQMRYFSIPELDFILKKCGLKSIHYEEWFTGKAPSENTWGICCIANLI